MPWQQVMLTADLSVAEARVGRVAVRPSDVAVQYESSRVTVRLTDELSQSTDELTLRAGHRQTTSSTLVLESTHSQSLEF